MLFDLILRRSVEMLIPLRSAYSVSGSQWLEEIVALGNGSASRRTLVEQAPQKRGRHLREINGEDDEEIAGGLVKTGADTGERPGIFYRIIDEMKMAGQTGSRATGPEDLLRQQFLEHAELALPEEAI